jgi:hypothetical protein
MKENQNLSITEGGPISVDQEFIDQTNLTEGKKMKVANCFESILKHKIDINKKYQLMYSPVDERDYFKDEVIIDSFQVFLQCLSENKYCSPTMFWDELKSFHTYLPEINFSEYSEADKTARQYLYKIGDSFSKLKNNFNILTLPWEAQKKLDDCRILSNSNKGFVEGIFRSYDGTMGPIITRITNYDPSIESISKDKLILENIARFNFLISETPELTNQLVFWFNPYFSGLSVYELETSSTSEILRMDLLWREDPEYSVNQGYSQEWLKFYQYKTD